MLLSSGNKWNSSSQLSLFHLWLIGEGPLCPHLNPRAFLSYFLPLFCWGGAVRVQLGGARLPVGAEPPGMQAGAGSCPSQAAKGATNTPVTQRGSLSCSPYPFKEGESLFSLPIPTHPSLCRAQFEPWTVQVQLCWHYISWRDSDNTIALNLSPHGPLLARSSRSAKMIINIWQISP